MLRRSIVPLVLLAVVAAGCARTAPKPEPAAHVAHAGHPGHPAEPGRYIPPGGGAPLFNDLGHYRYPVTTRSELAQRYYSQGFILLYGFNHAEAIRAFREAQRQDPKCAMCFWGEAYALGPHINKPMDDADVAPAWAALQQARRNSTNATGRERALIEALSHRYSETPVKDRAPLDRAYADWMREVAQAYPNDLDVQTLFAEAVMDTMPWAYYQTNGDPKPETVELIAALERVIARQPNHPGALHFYIHAVEASSTPARAEPAADRLGALVPGAGHLVHMPAHIYLRVGRYNDASVANEKAAAADESYISQCRVQGFYPAAYYSHNIHFLWASSSFEGRSGVALSAAQKLVANIPDDAIAKLPLVEEYLPTYLVGLARFGRWDEILAQPPPRKDLRYLTGMWHYARGVAFAGKRNVPAAERELREVRAIRDEVAVKKQLFLSGSNPEALLDIGTYDLEGRILGARGRWSTAVPAFRAAVKLQDALPYTEPPPWYFPEREALGHALLEDGRPAEAEAVYREQLARTPRNGWSLLGLAASLRAQGKDADGVEQERAMAWQRADVMPPSSVF